LPAQWAIAASAAIKRTSGAQVAAALRRAVRLFPRNVPGARTLVPGLTRDEVRYADTLPASQPSMARLRVRPQW
jgi:hypothetical protein